MTHFLKLFSERGFFCGRFLLLPIQLFTQHRFPRVQSLGESRAFLLQHLTLILQRLNQGERFSVAFGQVGQTGLLAFPFPNSFARHRRQLFLQFALQPSPRLFFVFQFAPQRFFARPQCLRDRLSVLLYGAQLILKGRDLRHGILLAGFQVVD